jgi:hypothetical protein
MKRLAAVAIVVAGLALPVCAQHRGAASAPHAGFSGHSAPASHPGFSSPAAGRFSGAPRAVARPQFAGRPQFAARPGAPAVQYRRAGSAAPIGRLGAGRDGHHRRIYISAYAAGYPYAYAPWIGAGYPFPLDSGDSSDDSGNAENSGPVYYDNGGYDNPGDDLQPPQQWPALGPYAPSAAGSGAAAGEQAVTLIFKDGRTEQVHNYVLTQTAIFVGDARGATIPLDQVDLPATEKANQDAGVDFRLPRPLN